MPRYIIIYLICNIQFEDVLNCIQEQETKTEIKPKRKIDPGNSTKQGSSPSIFTVVISRELRSAGHESGMKSIRNTYRIFVMLKHQNILPSSVIIDNLQASVSETNMYRNKRTSYCVLYKIKHVYNYSYPSSKYFDLKPRRFGSSFYVHFQVTGGRTKRYSSVAPG